MVVFERGTRAPGWLDISIGTIERQITPRAKWTILIILTSDYTASSRSILQAAKSSLILTKISKKFQIHKKLKAIS